MLVFYTQIIMVVQFGSFFANIISSTGSDLILIGSKNILIGPTPSPLEFSKVVEFYEKCFDTTTARLPDGLDWFNSDECPYNQ